MDLTTALASITNSFGGTCTTLLGFVAGLVPGAMGLVALVAGVGAAVALIRWLVAKL